VGPLAIEAWNYILSLKKSKEAHYINKAKPNNKILDKSVKKQKKTKWIQVETNKREKK
jgi:hypothetical protein